MGRTMVVGGRVLPQPIPTLIHTFPHLSAVDLPSIHIHVVTAFLLSLHSRLSLFADEYMQVGRAVLIHEKGLCIT